LEFVDTVRSVERTIAAGRRGDSIPEELDVAPVGDVTEEEWRAHWPSGGLAIEGEPVAADEAATVGTVAADEDAGEPDEDAGEPAADGSEAPSKASKRRRGRK
jgi:XTP/dITP diphosphohydrolase